MGKNRRSLELLSPAKNLATGIAAIQAGADAVYIGPENFGARTNAANSLADIAALTDFAHTFGAKVYVTLNTILHDNELPPAEKMAREIWRTGVDALIVQDLGLLRLPLPPIELHASTQCDIRSLEKAEMLSALGFRRLVVAREMTIPEIKEIHKVLPGTEIEAFVHGALCVSYSGDCHAGYALTGRSANRGECPQICRLKFSLTDSEGHRLAPDGHYLSLKDLNRLSRLEDMADAGVCSFKIEGRLKDIPYVRAVTAAYRREIDRIIKLYPERYCRASLGVAQIPDALTDTSKVFNRGFTDYFITNGPAYSKSLINPLSPKWLGEEIGKVKTCRGNTIEASLKPGVEVSNGDGLTAIFPDGRVEGFRINRSEGDKLFTAKSLKLPRGTKLLRNSDQTFDALMSRPTPERKIQIDVRFEVCTKTSMASVTVSLAEVESNDIPEYQGLKASISRNYEFGEAKTPQDAQRLRIFSKTGGTPFVLNDFQDLSPEIFLPASVLTDLRREALENFTTALKLKATPRRREYITVAEDFKPLAGVKPDYHWNISNEAAAAVLQDLGAEKPAPALESSPSKSGTARVMTTKFCLRRQLGACLKSPGAAKLPNDLFLTSPGIRLKLAFDCLNCRMEVYKS